MQCAAVVSTDLCGQSAQVCIVRLGKDECLVKHCRAVCRELDRKTGVQATVVSSSCIATRDKVGIDAGKARYSDILVAGRLIGRLSKGWHGGNRFVCISLCQVIQLINCV
jgi:hypothetical protein